MKLKIIGLFAFLLVSAVVAVSQHTPQPAQAPQSGPPMGSDPIAQNLFPPELVMQNRQALSLTEDQKGAIKDELMKASSRFSELQWQMQDEVDSMAGLLKGTSIDESRVMAQLDKVLVVEREVKRAQLTLAVRIKNKLTPEQQAKLMEIQRNQHDNTPRPPDR